MFWVATAPEPARTHAQRLATQGLEDVTTTPKLPLREQRPSREKVIVQSPAESRNSFR